MKIVSSGIPPRTATPPADAPQGHVAVVTAAAAAAVAMAVAAVAAAEAAAVAVEMTASPKAPGRYHLRLWCDGEKTSVVHNFYFQGTSSSFVSIAMHTSPSTIPLLSFTTICIPPTIRMGKGFWEAFWFLLFLFLFVVYGICSSPSG